MGAGRQCSEELWEMSPSRTWARWQPGLHIACLPALAPERRGFGEGKHLSCMPLSPPPLVSQISSMAGKQTMQAIQHPNQVETGSGIQAAAFASKSSPAFVTEVQ